MSTGHPSRFQLLNISLANKCLSCSHGRIRPAQSSENFDSEHEAGMPREGGNEAFEAIVYFKL